MKVAVIDYDAGNTLSVTKALQKVGANVDLTCDPGSHILVGRGRASRRRSIRGTA